MATTVLIQHDAKTTNHTKFYIELIQFIHRENENIFIIRIVMLKEHSGNL